MVAIEMEKSFQKDSGYSSGAARDIRRDYAEMASAGNRLERPRVPVLELSVADCTT
jgi:hypothetical protein